ncbi:MAG: hypothetical protein ACRCWW_20075 [Scandinavium sp.]|uniref:hypothetical protein n=1 Tax=Scandinavium sp. TaxID=2830653 RepID=UPI003F3244D4
MRRSYLPVMVAMSLTAGSAIAESINLRDPSIWQTPQNSEQEKADPCEGFQPSVCPGFEESKTDIEREQQRREENRHYNDIERWQRE